MKIPPPIQRLIDRILHWPPIMRLLEIMSTYNAAGGGLLAAGLAYGALFAALTGLLFVTGLVGFFIHDPATRDDIVNYVTSQVPPLEPFVRDGLLSMAANAGALSLFGLAGLGWGAAQFYGSIDSAFGRIFQRAPERGPIEKIIRGLLSVVIVVGALAAGIVTSSVQAILARDLPAGAAGDATRMVFAVAYPLLTVVLVIVAVALVYRLVPNMRVGWRVLLAPALVSGLVIAALTELFVFLAPRLVGSFAVFGGVAAVFAALTWLSWAFQVLLIGAAWTRERLPDAVAAVTGASTDELGADEVKPPAFLTRTAGPVPTRYRATEADAAEGGGAAGAN